MSEAQDTINRIKMRVKGMVIVNNEGSIVKNYYPEQIKK